MKLKACLCTLASQFVLHDDSSESLIKFTLNPWAYVTPSGHSDQKNQGGRGCLSIVHSLGNNSCVIFTSIYFTTTGFQNRNPSAGTTECETHAKKDKQERDALYLARVLYVTITNKVRLLCVDNCPVAIKCTYMKPVWTWSVLCQDLQEIWTEKNTEEFAQFYGWTYLR